MIHSKENDLKRLQNAISSLEITRYLLYHQLASMYPIEHHIEYLEALPICKVTVHQVPVNVLQFSFEGMLPIYFEIGDRFNKDHLREKYRAQTKDYYISAMHQAVKRQNIQDRFSGKVFIMIVHLYKDTTIRDLDNRNRKYLIDGLKAALIIGDDNWVNTALMEEAYQSKNGIDGVELFVTKYENRIELIQRVERMFS